ncbi:MAG: hypothetical protein IT459_22620 [Planctomycetes bacterium]|nr:hypothetical protein [Planctomycetota bacterium]
MSQPLPDWIVISPVAALAGAVGAILSLRSLEALTPRGRVAAVLGGFVCAVFLTGLCVDWLHAFTGWQFLKTTRGEAGVAFCLGLFGLSACGEVQKLVPAAREALANRWGKQ